MLPYIFPCWHRSLRVLSQNPKIPLLAENHTLPVKYNLLGYSRKHSYHPHGGNLKLTPLPPSDVVMHLLLSETLFSPLPLRTAEISSVGGVRVFSGMTHYGQMFVDKFILCHICITPAPFNTGNGVSGCPYVHGFICKLNQDCRK